MSTHMPSTYILSTSMSTHLMFRSLVSVCVFCGLLHCGGCDVGYFWHVTDFHYDHTYWAEGLSCNGEVPLKGQFGDYWCDSPWSLVTESISAMARVKHDVDFIIWTGDNVAHIKDEDLDLVTNLQVMQNLTTAITYAFKDIPVYASLGNHDFFPSNQASPGDDLMYDVISEMWRHWIKNTEQTKLFKKGAYYMSEINPFLCVISLNTNLYYRSNKLTRHMADPAGQLAWLRAQLQHIRANRQKVMIIAHIPVGLLAPGLVDWFHPDFSQPLLDIFYDYSDVITAAHFGHNHGDGFAILQNNVDSMSAVPQFMAPSVTPWRYKIPVKTGDPHNPGVRLVKYDRGTGENLDYHQFYMNLTDSNRRGHAHWRKLYTFTETYGVRDMGVTSLREVFDKMSTRDSEEAQKYCNYHVVSAHDKPCDLSFRSDIYCAGRHPNKASAQACKDRFPEIDTRPNKADTGYQANLGHLTRPFRPRGPVGPRGPVYPVGPGGPHGPVDEGGQEGRLVIDVSLDLFIET